MPLACSMCLSFLLTLGLMKNHLERYHKNDDNFHVVCQAPGCFKSYNDFEGYKTHLRRKHKDSMHKVIDDNPQVRELDVVEADHQIPSDDETPANDQLINDEPANLECESQYDVLSEETARRLNASYLLGTKEMHKLTQRTVDTVVQNTTSIVQNSITLLKEQLWSRLDTAGVDFRAVPGLHEFFCELEEDDSVITNPFLGVETKSQQDSAFKNLFGLVEPVRRVLGLTHGHRRNGVKRRAIAKPDEVIEIPFLKSIEQMLNDRSILYEVENPHTRADDLLADYCDGENFQTHPLFSVDATALQIMLYYDEIEIVNPLGSKTSKHKLGLFYYTLGNIRPEFRSQLKVIQLLALARRPVIKKYGINAVLETFVDELSELEQDAGYQFCINGELKSFRGTIAYVSGDNLGSQEVGGFKIGTAARFKCRECMGSANDITTKFHEIHFDLRTAQMYDDHCSRIQNSDIDITAEYGIRHSSILNTSRYYHVIGTLPGDAMHDILEGVLQYECKEFLKYAISDAKYITLEELNQRLLGHDYGYYNDKNKPSPLTTRTMNAENNSLKQSASQAWCLARHLPLILGTSIPEEDEKYQLLILLLEIVNIIFSPLISGNQASYLQRLIEEHHTTFQELYPNASIIPKMHYMVHYPRTITRLGPMVRSWCMRFESKHTYFKQVAIALGNYINVPYTVAERHQRMQSCHFMNAREQGCFLIKPTETGPGSQCTTALEVNRDKLQRADGNLQDDDLVYKPSWVKVLGTKYKIGAVVHVDFDNSLPTFGVIKIIYIISLSMKRIYFEVELLHTEAFVSRFHTYFIKKIIHPTVHVIAQHQLQYFLPLHLVTPYGVRGELHILPKFDIYDLCD